jgi:D-glycero-alpha-D-manno-heptose 1-phosphate guanylyltransferase
MQCASRRLPGAGSAAELDAFVLCGGLGTRLRAVLPEGPKALARVAGRPFLTILLESLRRAGVRRFVLCAGHGAEAIRRALPELGDGEAPRLCVEERPLGTGGALAHALLEARRDPLLVVNGDSLCAIELDAMLVQHRERRALLTLAAVRAERADAGWLRAAPDGRLLEFAEKQPLSGGLVSAGVYLIESRALAGRSGAFSLERELLPELALQRSYAFEIAGPLLDIGTPARLRGAAELLRRIETARGCAAPAAAGAGGC